LSITWRKKPNAILELLRSTGEDIYLLHGIRGCRLELDPARGELMKKAKSCTLLILLCLLVSFPVLTHADKSTAHSAAQASSSKSEKKYMKQQKKAQKSQNKATNAWKKRHHVAH
jgi:hypothetical protein